MAQDNSSVEQLYHKLSPIDAAINRGDPIGTEEFLAALDSLTAVFDTAGVDMLEGGRNDMAENIGKLRNRASRSPEKSQRLQDMILAERAEGQHDATEALLWLTRGLEFFVAAMKRTLANSSEKLSDSIMSGYKDTLKKHHGFIAKTAIKVGVSKTCPSREDLFGRLGQDSSLTTRSLQASVGSFEKILGVLQPFLARADVKF
ncbi:glycolipid transfer protein HET-C2 [Colletotrichum truncatum]|uniref:Glycolipid transfer protein HET-C2 n=1 Tax=Colletotrichum truncatum TaxID=5467 RepID=A0ACC3Z762_COLTU|nr:glycolipid transfer protein HET-C2 [Colletotrichum truncatum]KAF6785261.1 glycolipid transfer protein HET-C2 [Colletotrichum truncatum]